MSQKTLAKIYKDKKIIRTSDGSFTLYSSTYNESYKTKSTGAFTESYHKFIKQSNIAERLKDKDIRILDICFGLGQNIATTIHEVEKYDLSNRLHLVCVELDPHLIEIVKSLYILSPVKSYSIVRELLTNGSHKNYSLELYISDLRDILYNLSGKFDIIYFDPFSKKHNPELWEIKVFERLYDLLDDDGCMMTYASSKIITEDFKSINFKVEKINSIGSRRHPSIRLYKNIDQ